MEITLKSKRVVTYEKPGWTKRTEIWDETIGKPGSEIGLSLATCNKILLDCKVCTEQQLDNDEYKVVEVYEIANLLLFEIWSNELTKKK